MNVPPPKKKLLRTWQLMTIVPVIFVTLEPITSGSRGASTVHPRYEEFQSSAIVPTLSCGPNVATLHDPIKRSASYLSFRCEG